MKRMKNKILKALAYINGFVLVCAMAGADSEPISVPLTLIVITGAWLMLFAYANGYLNIDYKEEAESNENHRAKRGVHHSDGQRKRVEHHEAAGAVRQDLLQVGR